MSVACATVAKIVSMLLQEHWWKELKVVGFLFSVVCLFVVLLGCLLVCLFLSSLCVLDITPLSHM